MPVWGAIASSKHIPSGANVEENLWVNQLSKHFIKANHFAPEKWLGDETFAADVKAALKPFMTGPRNCIEQK